MSAPPDGRHTVDRETLRNGLFQRLIREAGIAVRVLTEEELRESLDRTLAARPAGEPVWLFAYGSLMSNPAVHVAERRHALVRGLHRRFCLWAVIGRGVPDNPGLYLGLEQGGACRGIALRMDEAILREELDVVWRREMVTGAYVPTWVTAETADGPVPAIAFRINHRHEGYAGRLPEEEVARIVAGASGAVGSCRDYLAHVVHALHEAGVRDRRMERLFERVEELAGVG